MALLPIPVALPPELCVHWERINYPDGPTSQGRCLKCGWEREYSTPYESPIYGNQRVSKIVLTRTEDWDD